MEKLLKAMGQEMPATKRILEINPDHPLFAAMNRIFEKNRSEPILRDFVFLLYDQALLLEGSKPQDTSAFTQKIARLMVESLEKTG